jgi:hypothetical protein
MDNPDILTIRFLSKNRGLTKRLFFIRPPSGYENTYNLHENKEANNTEITDKKGTLKVPNQTLPHEKSILA